MKINESHKKILNGKRDIFYLLIFSALLILLAVFSHRLMFHDASEYITIAKNLAGINNIDLFVGHSIVYPTYIAIFLKAIANPLTIRLVNVSWIILMASVIYFSSQNKKLFFLFIFSPIVWFVSIQTTPVLPASFFFLLSYLSLKKQIKNNYYYSIFFLGISCAFYTPMFLIGGIFFLIYFWNINIKKALFLFIVFLIGLSPRFIIEYYYFKNPFYTMIRYVGANVLISLGTREGRGIFQSFTNLETLLVLIFASPFLYKIFLLKNIRRHTQESAFIILSLILIYLRIGGLKYLLILTPAILFFLAKSMSKKEIKWHIVISLSIILIISFQFVTFEKEKIIESDLQQIIHDYNPDYIIGNSYRANFIATYLWEDRPRFEWYNVFNLTTSNHTYFKSYSFLFGSEKIPLRETIRFKSEFEHNQKINYTNYVFVTDRENNDFNSLNRDECYEALCVFLN
jgi:hypothetical protein